MTPVAKALNLYRDDQHWKDSIEARKILRLLAKAKFVTIHTDNNPDTTPAYITALGLYADDECDDGIVPTKGKLGSEVVSELTCVGLAHLVIEKNGKRFTLAFVWGNDAGEAISDWAGPLDSDEGRELDALMTQHYDSYA
jgi:hypothetical protein